MDGDSVSADGGAPAPSQPIPGFQANKLNDAVYELYFPSSGPPNLDIVFFHGLQVRDYYQAYAETWVSAKADQCWPQTWLAQDFPRARILSVSYDSSSIKGAMQGNMDMEATGQSVVDAVVLQAGVGQNSAVILVGHSLGGLVIKQMCLKAEKLLQESNSSDPRLEVFLNNVRGIFFYATPHHGSRLASVASYLPWYPSSLLRYLSVLNEETESLNDSFCELRKKYHWKASGLGEARQVFLPGTSRGVIVVPEESARCDMDHFAQLAEDHVSICKPKGKSCSSYRHLISFILGIVSKVHRLHGVPNHAAGLHSQVEEVKQLLASSPFVAILGREGIGLTSIAMAVFNTVSYDFDFTCFVGSTVKNCSARFEKLEARILSHLHHQGRKVKNCEEDWSILRGRSVLLVIDDVMDGVQVQQILQAASFDQKNSKVVITTHDSETLKPLHGFVKFAARDLNYKSAKKVFCHHAFDQPGVPHELSGYKGFVKQVVDNCGGLPLVLELAGAAFYKPSFKEYDAKVWMEGINRFKLAEALEPDANSKVLKKLGFCYDMLGGEEERRMFLEAARVFTCWPVKKVRAAWSTGFEGVGGGWDEVLASRLVKEVSHGNEAVVFVHPALRELAQSVGSEGDFRVYDSKRDGELLKVLLKSDEELAQLSSLMLSKWSQEWGPGPDLDRLAKMVKLKYLVIKNVPVKLPCQSLPESLSLLQWRLLGPSSPRLETISHLSNLAVLDLDARAQVREGSLDSVAESLGELLELRVLKLQGDFCQLPDTIGELRKLQSCVLSTGPRLKSLPESFGRLTALQDLVISNSGLVALPDSFANLSALRTLRLECSRLRELPDSFGILASLQTLALFCCEDLRQLPASFGDLRMLEVLEINVCPKLAEVPSSFSQLRKLRKLLMSYCGSLKWPLELGPLPNLTKLEIRGFDALPESLWQLSSLKRLTLSDVDTKRLPERFGELGSLQLLYIQRCQFVSAWHTDLQKLGWTGFYQRILQATEASLMEVVVYLRKRELDPLEDEANTILTAKFPHPGRWDFPKAMQLGPVLQKENLEMAFRRMMSRTRRN